MNNPLKQSVDDMIAYLLSLCESHGALSLENGIPDKDEDLIINGRIDSMGLVYMQSVIENEFSIELPIAILITELRTIHLIATHLVESGTFKQKIL